MEVLLSITLICRLVIWLVGGLVCHNFLTKQGIYTSINALLKTIPHGVEGLSRRCDGTDIVDEGGCEYASEDKTMHEVRIPSCVS